jgi:hypothetical protein
MGFAETLLMVRESKVLDKRVRALRGSAYDDEWFFEGLSMLDWINSAYSWLFICNRLCCIFFILLIPMRNMLATTSRIS